MPHSHPMANNGTCSSTPLKTRNDWALLAGVGSPLRPFNYPLGCWAPASEKWCWQSKEILPESTKHFAHGNVIQVYKIGVYEGVIPTI